MIKVLIADDELKVCQLINFLVDWQALGMKVVAIVHNGVDAINAIKEHKPNIIITDIRMPGCDGLEMIEQANQLEPDLEYIIISGYRQFDYAKKAISYGVSNYLLKPIDKNELIVSLEKVKAHYLEKTEQLSKDEKLKLFELSDVERSRNELFSDITLQNKLSREKMKIDYLNQTYQYHFEPGTFQNAMIKIDGVHEHPDNRYLEEKVSQILAQQIKNCYDWECTFEGNLCYLIINYNEKKESVRSMMHRILDEISQQQEVFRGLQVTIGLGKADLTPFVIADRFKAARWAVAQRLLMGTNKIIEGENRSTNDFVETNIFSNFNKELCDAIDLQDTERIRFAIQQLEHELMARKETTGYEILQMTKEAMNLFLFTIRNSQFPMESLKGLFEKFNKEINNYGSAHEVFQYLEETMTVTFEQVLTEKQQLDSKPIREAKKYISEHFTEPISLEMVSENAGFNTAYFSSMFKKETGMTFTEYLLSKRMDKAKELLKNTKSSVADICESVGYSDVKYFSKNFAKYTSLKPNEYRKLYS